MSVYNAIAAWIFIRLSRFVFVVIAGQYRRCVRRTTENANRHRFWTKASHHFQCDSVEIRMRENFYRFFFLNLFLWLFSFTHLLLVVFFSCFFFFSLHLFCWLFGETVANWQKLSSSASRLQAIALICEAISWVEFIVRSDAELLTESAIRRVRSIDEEKQKYVIGKMLQRHFDDWSDINQSNYVGKCVVLDRMFGWSVIIIRVCYA